MGDMSQTKSLENPTLDQALDIPPPPTKEEEKEDGGGGEKLSKKKGIFDFESWEKTLVMVPFTMTITIIVSLWAINGNGYFQLTSFPLHFFFFIVMLNFYVAVIGIIIRNKFPSVARCLYVVAVLCVLATLTMLFGAILPNVMNVVPWIFLAIVALLLISLVLYENLRNLQRLERYAGVCC